MPNLVTLIPGLFIYSFGDSLPVGVTLESGVLEMLCGNRKFNLGGLCDDEELDENHVGEPGERQ